ncbi:OmpA family/Membrane MotB of proton-channel complex MotA/MotB [Myroides sp. A21]|uniref:OmpA/MotB family protein n=1 Tax=Myroides sp. A21 TaxID=1583100 RepID=UPI00057CCBC9|nr:OmpA family protein [Myroides sp. A21]AJA69893.1 OmpA family/Membrane MotB of proton-channel complex MotA/MotB [Myroides sp. A21]
MSKKESFWLPYADLMTVLMIVFLFISVGYMAILQKKEKERTNIIDTYIVLKEDLYNDLKHEFKDDFKKWDLELDRDLSIKFTNPEILFQSGKAELTTKFEDILNEFVPNYLNIVLDKKYKGRIAEVRIEGHTDDVKYLYTKDSYIRNVELSQERSRNVLAYIRSLEYYKELSSEEESLLQFLLTANGLSYGRTLDKNKELTFTTKKEIDRVNSRRVEFKIVIASDDILNEVINKK